MKTEPPYKIGSVIYPPIITDLTPAEEKYMSDFTFGKKTYKKASRQAKEYIKILIAIIRTNKPDKGGYVHIPFNYLGSIFKSAQMAKNVFKCVLQGAIETDGHYNADAGISKGYKLTDDFKNCNVFADVIQKYQTRKPKPQMDNNNTANNTPPEENPYRDLTEDELNELLGGYVDSKPLRQPKQFTDKQLRTIEGIRQKNRTPFNCNRYRAVNIDPHETHVCMNCDHERPAYMYSLSQEGHLNDQCRGCYELAETEAEDMTEHLLKWVNRETPTQRSIRKLKAKMAELAA